MPIPPAGPKCQRACGLRSLWVALLGIALLAIGCATLALPTPEDAAWAAAQWPGTTQDDLERGRSLYVKRCAGCHGLHRPERFPQSSWAPHLDEMAERAGLKDGERELLLRYLITASRPQIAPAPVASPPPSG